MQRPDVIKVPSRVWFSSFCFRLCCSASLFRRCRDCTSRVSVRVRSFPSRRIGSYSILIGNNDGSSLAVKMGRRKKDGSNLKGGICKGVTLREEILGKKEVDVSSILKIKHLQNLAAWSGGEGGIPSLGAFFGYQLAANAEVSGVPLDKSSFFCQSCESSLQPGFNCTIRIEKCKLNKQRRSCKKSNSFQNNVIYKCSFCHHRNAIKGTTKGHLKSLISSKESRADPILKSNSFSITTTGDQKYQNTPVTPLKSTVLSKNKRKMSELESGKLQPCSSGGSSRRKRKTWSNLKDIVEKKETESNQSVSNYVIPFFMQT